MICIRVLAYFCSINLISDGPFGLYSTACNNHSLCINISFSPRNLLQWGKHSYCFCLPVSLLLCNIFPSSVMLSPAFLKEVLGVLFYRSVHFLLIFLIITLLFQKKWGMKGDFLLTSFAPSQMSCHMHSSFLHRGRKCLAGAATGSTPGPSFCESKWRMGER